MALDALFVGLFLLFQHVTGSTYLVSQGPGDVTILQCLVPTGAGNEVTLCSSTDLGAEMDKIKCENKEKERQLCENLSPNWGKRPSKPECRNCKLNEEQMESQSLTFQVKTFNSTVFTCSAQDFRGSESSNCPSWLTLSGEGCENHDLFFVIIQSDSDEIFGSLTVSKGAKVTLPCQFKNRKHLPFTLFWIRSGNVNKCLHSVHIEDDEAYSNTRCCVDRKSSERISTQSSDDPTARHQSHKLTIHSADVVDTGRYLCAVHGQDSEKPVWKIVANISLTVTEVSAETSDTPTSTSRISSVTSNITPTNTQSPYTSCSDIRICVLVLYLVVLVCIDGTLCIIQRKRQAANVMEAKVKFSE